MLIGKNAQSERFYLHLEIKNEQREGVTVEHEPIKNYQRLSLTGEVIGYRKRNAYNFGQIENRLHEITEPANGLTLAGVARIFQIWKEWHLNDMQSHCIHQDSATKWDEVEPCSLTGYKAGSAWLVKPLSAEVIAEIKNLLNEKAVA